MAGVAACRSVSFEGVPHACGVVSASGLLIQLTKTELGVADMLSAPAWLALPTFLWDDIGDFAKDRPLRPVRRAAPQPAKATEADTVSGMEYAVTRRVARPPPTSSVPVPDEEPAFGCDEASARQTSTQHVLPVTMSSRLPPRWLFAIQPLVRHGRHLLG